MTSVHLIMITFFACKTEAQKTKNIFLKQKLYIFSICYRVKRSKTKFTQRTLFIFFFWKRKMSSDEYSIFFQQRCKKFDGYFIKQILYGSKSAAQLSTHQPHFTIFDHNAVFIFIYCKLIHCAANKFNSHMQTPQFKNSTYLFLAKSHLNIASKQNSVYSGQIRLWNITLISKNRKSNWVEITT